VARGLTGETMAPAKARPAEAIVMA